MPETRDEEIKRIVENRRRNAEIKRAEQIKKRNMTLAGIAGVVILLILIIIIGVSCSSKKGNKSAKETTAEATTVEVTTVVETTTVEETTNKKNAAAETTVKAVETTKTENQSESATTGDNASASTSMYTNDGVNLRSEASTDSSDNVVTTIEKGEKVEVLSNEGDWTRIKYNGKTGYVATRFLSEKNVYDEKRIIITRIH